ncbi:TPA: flagellar hook length control protein FliK [Enterobacter hormaechei subsp. steigerwaltii]|uniref:flagellar hook length control protein FliK n=1 Tax=Enterobacter hormaechei TaxID=158836 RepID=UPI0013D3DB86|nr:flagellar hook length control protein FliK [Enterobacter hormaechei]HAV1453349.1 flagellar hook length control protein FliK [Enterobacter hormaechei subsp. steigerwaltii]HCJ7664758.1 flagellar hook length control protein FliK [Enterobacter hormaechei subsp. xiangfangensis]HAV1836343.1 flagellar hook length control protein FliK [Enterobacter hormaechei subsp. steigerwaltii]HAV1918709.1 flagellar hook length control protein FliK [Enterobacter hormaechei subsp. steigerwaltii]HCR0472200.1 flage
MITLQQLLMTDSDPSGGTLTGKGAEGAQDFLSLLAGALTETTGKGKDAPLTLADLKAAGSKLSTAAKEKNGDTTLQAKIAELLSRQETLTGEDTAVSLQSLVSGLKPAANTDALKALTQPEAKTNSETTTEEEELAGLSALMAMLPHQQTTTPVATQPASTGEIAPRAALPSALALTDNGQHQPLSHALTGQEKMPVQDSDTSRPATAAVTPAVAAVAEKQDVASAASSAASPTATLAPIVSHLAPSQPAATVATAPVLSQPLGTHEWQQNLSQHITLFTKQGQQTAELRLHPEDLGQVQISLKLDDNQAQLQMVSPHSHVRAALEAALPILRTQLAENGIQLSQSSVSSEGFAGQQQSSSGQQQHTSRSGQHGGFNDESEELLPAPAALQSAARGSRAVDIFA